MGQKLSQPVLPEPLTMAQVMLEVPVAVVVFGAYRTQREFSVELVNLKNWMFCVPDSQVRW